MIGIGLGLPFIKSGLIDSQAQDHFNRVVADGGTIPAGLVGCDAWFKAVKGVYGVSDITSAISSGIHPHYLGYKAGAGSGATLGSAAQTCYNAIGSTGDVVQTTAASQPLILPHTGTNYVWLPGVSGNGFTTPNNINNQLIDNFGFEFFSSNISTNGAILGKMTSVGSNSAYYVIRIAGGAIRLGISLNGTTFSTYDSSTTSNNYFRISRNATSGTIKFFTSSDGVTWSQLGSDVSGVTGSLFNSTGSLNIGALNTTLTQNTAIGVINYVNIYKDDTFTTPTQIFNPASYSRATSGTTWTSTTGEVWTINTPSINNALKAAIVDTTYLMGNGTSIGMRAASLNMTQTGVASYTAIRKFVNTVGSQIITELGTSISSAAGKYFGINFTASQEEFGVYANVGLQNSRYSSTSTALKLATQIIDITNANEASPYLINNSSQTFVAQDSANNNTAAMNGTGYNLLARNNAASLWANVMMACDIVSKNADSTGTQTAMYTALKPFLVNAI